MKKILITGGNGLLGSACIRYFSKKYDVVAPNKGEFNLIDESQTDLMMETYNPDVVIHCAAKVGGVKANRDFPVQFLTENIRINTNVIDSAATHGVLKLAFIGTSCMFPCDAAVPVVEESLLTGKLEDSVEAYAIAKIAGWRLCKAHWEQYGRKFFTVNPCNIYGVNDTYGDHAHVIPSLIRKFYEAIDSGRPVTVWGDGSAVREFIYSEDVARAIDCVLENWNSPEVISIGTGVSTTIRELVDELTRATGFHPDIIWDSNEPTGIPRKTFNVDKLKSLGWRAVVPLSEGLSAACADYRGRFSK